MRIRVLALGVLLLGLASSSRPESVLRHDFYVWQRQWTPAVSAAVRDAGDLARAWRVLGAVVDPAGRLTPMQPDRAALKASNPVILVVRIDAPHARWDQDRLLREIPALVGEWRGQGLPLTGLEVDFDSPTAWLSSYGSFLAALRARLDRSVRLSATSLPTWLSARAFDSVLAPLDEIVLQVHAVDRADRTDTLFDAGRALAWREALAARTAKPYWIALPTYGVRIARDADRSVVSVTSEFPWFAGGTSAVEMMAAPEEVAAMLAGLRAAPDRHLQGIVWFRLPTEADCRAWSLPTLRAVIEGRPARGRARVAVQEGAVPGAMVVALRNDGGLDVPFPHRVALPEGCQLGDGAGRYEWRPLDAALTLRAGQDGILRPGQGMQIGWARCPLASEDLIVEP